MIRALNHFTRWYLQGEEKEEEEGEGGEGEGEGYTLYPVVNIRNLPAELAQDFTHLRYIHVQEGEEPKGGRGRKILFSCVYTSSVHSC